jgi:hypothetical protein
MSIAICTGTPRHKIVMTVILLGNPTYNKNHFVSLYLALVANTFSAIFFPTRKQRCLWFILKRSQ